ncbi:hypothetical protein EE612_050242 [Oryza sativa]|nr:hypothetical protein EE612_050242 [Oryza sativa]
MLNVTCDIYHENIIMLIPHYILYIYLTLTKSLFTVLKK